MISHNELDRGAELFCDRTEDSVRLEWCLAEPDSGGIRKRVAHSRGNRIVGTFAHRLGAQRANTILGIGKKNLGTRYIAELRQMVIPECRIDDAALIVNHHFLIQRRTQGLGNTTFDLPLALHGVDDCSSIRSMYAAQDFYRSG